MNVLASVVFDDGSRFKIDHTTGLVLQSNSRRALIASSQTNTITVPFDPVNRVGPSCE